ncbi:hypothetical protein QAD02_017045 [Eretmocerus hayati]|uniref:Uncharacterized protein n=1 Tax=Eretmocerus hayati TaxID=131215 RepID=A0ACC2PDT2_9HYME|nr:hypothetical protein QAD02_017045 [Eretmocerus hayati]
MAEVVRAGGRGTGTMLIFFLLLGIMSQESHASMYSMPAEMKAEHMVNELLLRELLERMANNGGDLEDNLLQQRLANNLMSQNREDSREEQEEAARRQMQLEFPLDFGTLDALGQSPKTSIRDQEYLRHSSLWSTNEHQDDDDDEDEVGSPIGYVKSNERHKIKPAALKQLLANEAGSASSGTGAGGKGGNGRPESQLPAYCTPPNPCPVGYTAENQCIENFENSAGFSRDYQSSQDCMCDSEHMLQCPNSVDLDSGIPITNSDFEQIVERFQENNPYFHGEKLPIAAKKGINVLY